MLRENRVCWMCYEDMTRMLRGCYEETAAEEFRLGPYSKLFPVSNTR